MVVDVHRSGRGYGGFGRLRSRCSVGSRPSLRQRTPGTGTPYVSRSKPNLDHVSRPSVHPLWSMFFIQSVATGPYYSSYKTESSYVNNLGRYKANPFFDGNRLGMLRGGLWRGFRKIELEQLSGHVTKHVIQRVTCSL